MIRKFEIPYNFDPLYIDTLVSCKLTGPEIAMIYMAPFHEDYTTIIRKDPYNSRLLTREQYVAHIKKVKSVFEGRMQLLLQNKTAILPIEKLKWYIDLGFTSFCCGNPAQAEIIKKYNDKLTIIGSIVLHIEQEDLTRQLNAKKYEYFDYFVLDFSYGRDITKIKFMPENKKYLILVNAICHSHCDGDHHWNVKSSDEHIACPGKYGVEHKNFSQTVWIRPMDLKYFDPWISIYKIQDRSWPTFEIIRDLILYTQDYSLYPGIEYNEGLYDTD